MSAFEALLARQDEQMAELHKLRVEFAVLKNWEDRAVASMNEACAAVGAMCCDEIPKVVAVLKAEREEYKRNLQTELDGHKEWRNVLGALENETMFKFAERIRSECDALRQDAERYREIKKYAQSGIDMTTNGVKGKTVWKVRLPDASWHSDAWTGPTFDAAIDAARTEGK